MKNLKKVMFLAVAIFALALSSCSSDDSSDENQTETNYIKFKYKGTAYTFDSGYQSSLTLDVIGSEGLDNKYKQIALHMPLDPSVGSHPVVYDLSNMTTTSGQFLPSWVLIILLMQHQEQSKLRLIIVKELKEHLIFQELWMDKKLRLLTEVLVIAQF